MSTALPVRPAGTATPQPSHKVDLREWKILGAFVAVCLVPALFIAGSIGVFVSQAADGN